MWLIGLIILIIGLIISVALHELGHLVPAKKFGTMVPEYWVGFGPTLWQTKRGSTTYGIKAVLLGGYVRIVGMFPGGPENRKRQRADGRLTLVEEARQQSMQDVEEARAAGGTGVPFYELSTPRKVAVMSGGPLMNLAISFVLIAVVLLGFGYEVPTTTIEQVAGPVNGVESPAAEAGLQAGDTLVAWDGVPVEDWEQLRELISSSPASGATATVERDGELMTFEVVPVINDDGSASIGITSLLGREPAAVGDVFSTTWQLFTGTGKAIIGLPVSVFNLGKSMLTGEERDSEGVISIVGVARFAGEITSPSSFTSEQTTSTGTLTQSVSFADRMLLMLSLLASLNMALFVFNLIPLPPLDGGHIMGALWGGARNASAKLRGKPKPPPADTARMVPLTYAVFGALMVLTLILILADIFKPLSLA